jgi:acetyl-CoA C-acetyltransferase
MKATRVGIIGIGQSEFKPRRDDANYPELVREGVTLALNDAKRDLADMEAVVYSLAPDALLGIGNAERLGVDAVGARNKRFMRINTGGSTGLSSVAVGHAHVAAGACDLVLVAGGDKVGESGDSQTILNKIWDPTYERQLPLGTITMLAMSAVRAMHKYGLTEEDMARVTVKNRGHAALNPKAHLRKKVTIEDVFASRYISWPIKLLDACPQSSGGCAMVLASERYIKENKLEAVWITGAAHCSESYFIGDRMGNNYVADHADAHALRESFERTYRMAGIKNPAKEVHVAELYAPFSNTEFHAIESAGLAGMGKSMAMLREGAFHIGSPTAVNPSGGTLCTNAIAVSAMVRVAEGALQVWGRAGGHQQPGARVAACSGNGGDHQFFGTAVVEA